MMSNTAEQQKVFEAAEFGLVPIAVATLCPAEKLDFDLYLPGEPPKLYRGQTYPLQEEDLARIKTRGVHTLYVPMAGHLEYQRYVQENLDSILTDTDLPAERRYQMLREASRKMLEESFRGAEIDQIVTGVGEVSAQVARLALDRNLVVFDLVKVMSRDFNTFAHMLNVSIYCVLLAQQMGITNQQDLESISVGALLHDLGKLHVPTAILNKAGRLTEKEENTLRQHPRIGFKELCLRQDLNLGQLMMVYRHHERMDGGGYPVGVSGEEIHSWARLCAVANVFDATRGRRSLGESQEYLEDQAGTRLDKEMVKCWNSALTPKR